MVELTQKEEHNTTTPNMGLAVQQRSQVTSAALERSHRKVMMLKGLFEAAGESESRGAVLRLDRAVVLYLMTFRKLPFQSMSD